MKKRTLWIFGLVVAVWISLPVYTAEESQEAPSQAFKSIAKPGETYLLKYAFKADQAKTLICDTTMEFTNQIGEMAMPMAMNSQATIAMKTVSVDEQGAAKIDLNLDALDGTIEFAGQKQKVPPQMVQARTGSIQVSTAGELLDGPGSSNPALMGPAGTSVVMMVQSLYVALPKDKVAVGEPWKQEVDVAVPGSKQTMKETTESVLKDVVEIGGQKVALLSIQVKRTGKDIEIDAQALAQEGAPMPPQAGTITLTESTQTRDLTIYFNLDTGAVRSVQEKTTVKSTISGFGGAAQTMKMDMKAEIGLTVTDR